MKLLPNHPNWNQLSFYEMHTFTTYKEVRNQVELEVENRWEAAGN